MNDQKTILQPISALLGKSASMVHIPCGCSPICKGRKVQIVVHGKNAGRCRIDQFGGCN
jgi:hypothetical protein